MRVGYKPHELPNMSGIKDMRDIKELMKMEWLFPVGVVVLWLLLQLVILPRLGVKT